MWNLPANCDTPVDTEASALVFIQRFVYQVWKGVVSELENVIDECSKHIIYWVRLLYLWIDHLGFHLTKGKIIGETEFLQTWC